MEYVKKRGQVRYKGHRFLALATSELAGKTTPVSTVTDLEIQHVEALFSQEVATQPLAVRTNLSTFNVKQRAAPSPPGYSFGPATVGLLASLWILLLEPEQD